MAAPVPAQQAAEEEEEEFPKVIVRSQSILNRHLNRLNRVMEGFERQQGSESVLTLNDFRKL